MDIIISSLSENEIEELNKATSIDANLIIDLPDIIALSGFNNLKSLKSLTVKNMDTLVSISGFNSLDSLESLIIDNNKNLKEIYGFNSLFMNNHEIRGVIKIINNKLLKKISFLRGLKKVSSSFYLHHNGLETLEGLEDLEHVNASLSLSSNKLKSLKELKKLKYVDGMLGVVNNQLTTLYGLESLEHLKSVKWNTQIRTLAINSNKELHDISALKNVKTFNKELVIICDKIEQYTTQPKSDTTFFQNVLNFFEPKNNKRTIKNAKPIFPKIISICSSNDNSSKEYPLKNLIEGTGIGFHHQAPYDAISKDYWSTKKVANGCKHYFEINEPIVIDMILDGKQKFNSISIWSSKKTFGNSIKEFTLQFNNGLDDEFSTPIHFTAYERNPFEPELFEFEEVKCNIIRLSILSNHHEVGLGGDCVDLQEIAIIRDVKAMRKEIRNSQKNSFEHDFLRGLIPKKLSDYDYYILSIFPEFSLDDLWKPNMTYHDFIEARGLNGIGPQIKRINLSKWGDKIYMHHFLKEHGIKGMPVKLFTNRFDKSFMLRVKELYNKGLKSFVLKVTHLGDSNGVYRVKNGVHITPNELRSKNKKYGKPVDFDYLENEIKLNLNNQQYHEDWVSNLIAPGVILEEYLEDPTELKICIVFGKVINSVVAVKGYPTFDSKGKPLKNIHDKPPSWWREAYVHAERVAQLIRADNLRIDIFHNKGELIVCEVNWNGAQSFVLREEYADELNYGYNLRKKYLIGVEK